MLLSNSLLHHLHDPAGLWREITLRGRPGALVQVMDLRRPDDAPAADALVERYAGDEPLAVLAHMVGASFTTVTNRIKVQEQRDLLYLLGANIEELPGLSECPDLTNPNDPLTRIPYSETGFYDGHSIATLPDDAVLLLNVLHHRPSG